MVQEVRIGRNFVELYQAVSAARPRLSLVQASRYQGKPYLVLERGVNGHTKPHVSFLSDKVSDQVAYGVNPTKRKILSSFD